MAALPTLWCSIRPGATRSKSPLTLPGMGNSLTWEGERMDKDRMNLLQGTLDVLILQALSDEPLHGYGVSRLVRDRTRGTLQIEDAPLYKALHRLEHAGCVAAEWGVSEHNRRARYYRLTASGRRRLRRDTQAWRRYATAVASVLGPK